MTSDTNADTSGEHNNGTQGCKRFAISSPGNADFEKEVTSIADGIQTLVHTSKSISSPAFALDGRSRR